MWVPLSPVQALPENSTALISIGRFRDPVDDSIAIGLTAIEWATGFAGFEKVH